MTDSASLRYWLHGKSREPKRRLGVWLAALALVASTLLAGQPAECVWCPTYPCYGPCGQDCVCLSPPGTPGGGECWGASAVPHLLAKGWTLR